MYCSITALPLAFYRAGSDDTVRYKFVKWWIFAVLDVQVRRLQPFS